MVQGIHEPIDITIDPRVRAIMRNGRGDGDFEVADIQNIIKAMSVYHNKLRHQVNEQGMKIARQKKMLTRKDETIALLRKELEVAK